MAEDCKRDQELTLELLNSEDTHKAEVFTTTTHGTAKYLVFSRHTPLTVEQIEETLYKKGFKKQDDYLIIISNMENVRVCESILLLNPRPAELNMEGE